MNISTSEYSSGCESGWTTYLDQLSNSTRSFHHGNGTFQKEEEEEEDEDLSMVSDASSGPPHYACTSQDSKKNRHNKIKTREPTPKIRHNLCLDDTASSPFFNFSLGNVPTGEDHNSVEGFPAPHLIKGESKAKKHLSLFKSSTKGKSGSLLGRKRQ